MIQLRSSADPTAHRSRQEGTAGAGLTGWVTTYMGVNRTNKGSIPTPPVGVIFPVAHLAEQEAGTALKPHFHKANQFQIFVRGDGFLGKTPVSSVTVHYTNAGTPYGPITAGPEGLAYLTLRNTYDPGPRNMPESREALHEFERVPRHVTVQGPAQLPAGDLAALTNVVAVEVQERGEDGLSAKVYRIPPGATVAGTDPTTGRGQHWIVLGGAMERDGALLPPNSCLFLSPDEPAFVAKAGPDGLEVLELQYPTGPIPHEA